jgi:hypothetical protein
VSEVRAALEEEVVRGPFVALPMFVVEVRAALEECEQLSSVRCFPAVDWRVGDDPKAARPAATRQ